MRMSRERRLNDTSLPLCCQYLEGVVVTVVNHSSLPVLLRRAKGTKGARLRELDEYPLEVETLSK